jgi:hypothetical protein
MKCWAVVCLLTLSGCFIPTKWKMDPESHRMTGILIQSPIEIGSFADTQLPFPWCPNVFMVLQRQLEKEREERERIIAEYEAAQAQRRADESISSGEPIEQATFVEASEP